MRKIDFVCMRTVVFIDFFLSILFFILCFLNNDRGLQSRKVEVKIIVHFLFLGYSFQHLRNEFNFRVELS